MTVTRLLVILLICGVLYGGIYFGGMLLLGNSLTKGERLSDAERKMVERLENKYNCDVRIRHDSKAIDPETEDSTIYVFIDWIAKGKELKDSTHNVAIQPDSSIIQFSTSIAKELLNIVPHKTYYRSISVLLQDIYTYNGTIEGIYRDVRLKHTLIDGEMYLVGFDKREHSH